jgi:hypothetical protein
MLRRHRQRPSERHRCSGRRRRGGYARPRDCSAPGCGTKHPCWSRHRRAASPSSRARGQAGGGVSDGAAAPRLHGRGSLRAQRTHAGVGHTGPQPHQRRLQCRQPGHASAGEPEAYRHCNAAAGHAAPSTPEARNLHREVQSLIEQAAVQQAESSASRIRQQGDARGDGAAQGANPRSMQVKRRSDPPTRGAHRPKSGSSTRAGHWTVTPVMSSTLGGRSRRMRE